MKKFDVDLYFSLIQDSKVVSPAPVYFAQPQSSGIELISQYLQDKYQTNISHPIRTYSSYGSEIPYPIHVKYEFFSEVKDITPHILAAQRQSGDYRQAFVIGEESHAMFMVYIKEGH